MDSRWHYLLMLALVLHSFGCAALGPFSPLRPVERALVFAPSPSTTEAAPEPGGQVVSFTTDDGVRLQGHLFEHPEPRAVALFCHGNAGSLESWSEVGRQLSEQHQLTVLAFDYRGYGHSAGSPTEVGVLRDGRAAQAWLARHAGIQKTDVVVIGRSLGGAVAVDLAANEGARGLVLESTFSSLPDVAAVHAPWIMPHLNMTQRLNSAGKIASYRGPVLQCHGDADRLIPLKLARKLHAAIPGKKRFEVIPGADHNDPQGAAYAQALDEFLESLPHVRTHSQLESPPESGLTGTDHS